MNIEEVYQQIHKGLHDPTFKNIYLTDGSMLIVNKSKSNGCKCVKWKNILFMEQNKAKKSEYAERARNGEKLTWAIDRGVFTLITDKGIQR